MALGSLNADVVVTVTVDALKDPATATEYDCSVSLSGVTPPVSPSSRQTVYLDFGNTRFPLAAGAPFMQTVHALIPR